MKKSGLVLFLLPFLALASVTAASADLVVSPLRSVISEDQPHASVTISNPTGRIITGRISWIELAATETGYRHAETTERKAISAAPWLVLSPARFRLEPGERATIAIRIKDGMRPPPGEHRSHLLIETDAARTLLRKASNQGLQPDISAGVSTPVILRGAGDARAELGATRLVRDKEGLLLVETSIEQKGSLSSYGRLIAEFRESKPGGVKQVLAARENVAGYLDVKERKFELPLGYFRLGNGELTLRYEGTDEFAGRLFDERRFEITPPEKN